MLSAGEVSNLAQKHELRTQIQQFRETFYDVKAEVQKRIVGQDAIVEGVLFCLLANGHALLEGIPGLGKTQLIYTLSEALDLSFKRIQFTPDMMPSDITGTTLLVEDDRVAGSLNSNRDRFSLSSFSPTRSTAPPPARNRRSSRRCKSGLLPSDAPATN